MSDFMYYFGRVCNFMVPMAFLPEVVSFAIILIRNILTSFLRITGCPVRRGLSVMALLGQMICL